MRIRSTKPEFWRSRTVSSVDWSARLVLKGLESYVDDNGVGKDDLALIVSDVFPRDMAENPRDTLARVSEAISSLHSAGLVHRYEVDGRPLIYISNWENIQRIDKPGKGRLRRPDGTMDYRDSIIPESVANVRESVAPGTGEQGNRGTEEQVVKTCSPASPPSVIEPDRFDEFYAIYPRKVGKATAKTAFVKAAKKVGAQTVIDGAHQLANDPNLPEKQLIPHPATWLNRDGWEDEPHPPRNVQRPDAHQMTSREQTWMQAELMKDNPDPRAIQMSGGTPQLRMLG